MEPGAQRIAHPERTGLLDQDQEGRLKGVFHIVRVDQHAPADAGPSVHGDRVLGPGVANACSARPRVANRSRSCPSVSSPAVPTASSVPSCRKTR